MISKCHGSYRITVAVSVSVALIYMQEIGHYGFQGFYHYQVSMDGIGLDCLK